MSVLKCKMCGASLVIPDGNVVQCEYCGTVQNVSRLEHANDINVLKSRGEIALQDKHWDKAKEVFEQLLDYDPESTDAYSGLAMAEYKISAKDDFFAYIKTHDCFQNDNVKHLYQFSSGSLKFELDNIKEIFESGNSAYLNSLERFKNYSGKIATGVLHSLVLNSNGMVIATGDNRCGQCDVKEWKNVKYIAAAGFISACIFENGTVAVKGGAYGNADLSGVRFWKDIVQISVGHNHIVGVRNNGRPFSVGYNNEGQCDVLPWNNIRTVAAGYAHSIGLKHDGTVVAVGNNKRGQCDVSNWKNIQDIACGNMHTVGLCNDGTVVAVGKNDNGECNVSSWKNIVAISACQNHTIGISSDGTVHLTGQNTTGKYDVSHLSEVVAISIASCPAGHGDLYTHIVAINKNGDVITVGDNNSNQLSLVDVKAMD